ncbi:hypothetical protein KBI51_02670 [Aerococcaceae bacterium zg-ZUI334]|uniref:hypothetical protein n=1 Tax=Aerococcaceae bacterium zg-252 TaxID=2796928 RepID=UPI001B8E746B|nr:hypothetical protein [Aerococcaceae bacterium zg-ZUI334]
MQHQLKVSVSKTPCLENMMTCRKLPIREKILRFFFGKKQDLVVLIPSDRIVEVAISKKGESNGKNEIT